MNLLDSFYTPPDLAKRLVQYVGRERIGTVADFCVGNGELLRALVEKKTNVKCFGIDISRKAISAVSKLHPNWKLSCCDFLNEQSRKLSKVLKTNKHGFDLILLNPPFSCIGGSIHTVELDDQIFTSSTSMKFLAESIKFLSKKGKLYSIMPISSAYSQKDKMLWDYLKNNYHLSVRETPNGNHFKECSASVLFVSINDDHNSKVSTSFKKISLGTREFSLFRGNLSMHTVQNNESRGKYVVHTTNLLNNKIANIKIKSQKWSSEIRGPAILIPRVGQPNRTKIVHIQKGESYIISDCIIAIKTKTNKEANDIKLILIRNWKSVEELYKGTGAKYLTIDRLSKFIGLKK